jgi:cysteine desulfurase
MPVGDDVDSGAPVSTNRRIYLDFNATAPLVLAARDAMVEAMGDVGNPSSIHAEGRRMRDRVERARNQVAALLGRPREQIVFTSGGTEANWLGVHALAAVAEQRGLPKIVATTAIEHPSLRGAVGALVARGWEVVDAGADIGDRSVGVAALGLVNHELGTILDSAVVAWARARGALIHLDAVQAAGKLPLLAVDADSLAISGHKIGGPQGVGALAIAVDDGLPIVEAGHQERGRRPGTENTLGIIGFGAAARGQTQLLQLARTSGEVVQVVSDPSALGARLEAALRAMGARIHGDDRPRVGGTINAAWPGALGESIVMALDLAGISVSTGAACTSGSIQPSAVLLGLGYSPAQAREAVRFSLGPTTEAAEIDAVIRALPDIVERARRHR